QRQVNFDDYSDYTPPKFDPYDTPSHPGNDAASTATFATSGIRALGVSGKKNGLGQAEAEEVTSSYQDFSSSPVSGTSRALNNSGVDRRTSDGSQYSRSYAQSNKDALVYTDEGYDPYASRKGRYTDDDDALVQNAADMGRSDQPKTIDDLEYQDPYNNDGLVTEPAKESAFARFFGGKYPVEQRIENKKRGIGRQRYPFLVWILTVVMIAVFIYELVLNGKEQGSPISLKPVVNYMLGPSESALIYVGSRFPPCMKDVTDVPISLQLPCMNDTANPPDKVCPISELCGFGGIGAGETPNQWFRFITPIFVHAGIIHIVLNMLAQMLVSAQIEREMGSGGFFLVYFAAGIFGNVLGGNFSLVGVPSVGASGAIFGTVAVMWVDLFAHWKYHYKPVTRLIYMSVELVIGVGVGFIPYVDNFAHLGGFLMGLLVGTTFYPVISETKRHKAIMWGFRIAALPFVIVLFVVLTRNFYTSDPYAACSWCRYLSCIPTSSNNHCQGTGITTTTTSNSSGLRMLLL
ncbi:rhomboid-domain-containing protein, partial [Phellopilus nigrolimitatus]